MKRTIIVVLLVTAVVCVTSGQTTKPNISGAWERVAISGAGNPGAETMTFFHNEPYVYLLYRIKDGAGERTLDLKGIIDGKPHTQEIEGRPATLTVQWEGQNLILDIKREASFGYSHTRRKMMFSADGKAMTTERTWYTKEGALRKETGAEKWQRK
ncbi:MAG: hypothetical protein JMDDDDMK_02567 [Acidobacteria bacterium]|nr:hypothetical protein [Acidobacteriota bacterium]